MSLRIEAGAFRGAGFLYQAIPGKVLGGFPPKKDSGVAEKKVGRKV
ncbi:hypothetical protein RHODOSMS8_03337 [Rhodobiaceae bacterium]|nr:hypothetical protein RHODOSMS8_03337 [Rhodobiaceae bacterium]